MLVREKLKALPFVREKPDGTLDLWSAPKAPQNDPGALPVGRAWAAGFLRLLRTLEDPTGPHYHVSKALRPHLVAGCPFARGFRLEMGQVLASAPALSSPEMVLTRGLRFSGNVDQDLKRLPWVQVVDGKIASDWCPKITGDDEKDHWNGRHAGAVLCELIRQTRWVHVLTLQAVTPPSHEEFVRGMDVTITQNLVGAPWGVTCFQRASDIILAGDDGARTSDILERMPELRVA